MLGRPWKRIDDDLALAREQHRERHAETMRYLALCEEEAKRREKRRDEEARRRDEEAKRRDEEARRRDAEAKHRELEFQRFCTEADARTREMREESRAQTEELRQFTRELLLRNEKVYTTMIAEMEEGRKQIAANTEAVLSVLDRLNGSGPRR